jgi:hypothetical protein
MPAQPPCANARSSDAPYCDPGRQWNQPFLLIRVCLSHGLVSSPSLGRWTARRFPFVEVSSSAQSAILPRYGVTELAG